VEYTKTGGKKKQNIAGGKKFRNHRTRKGDTIVSDYSTNAQIDISFHSKTQNDKQEDQTNKEVHKRYNKPYFKATITLKTDCVY